MTSKLLWAVAKRPVTGAVPPRISGNVAWSAPAFLGPAGASAPGEQAGMLLWNDPALKHPPTGWHQTNNDTVVANAPSAWATWDGSHAQLGLMQKAQGGQTKPRGCAVLGLDATHVQVPLPSGRSLAHENASPVSDEHLPALGAGSPPSSLGWSVVSSGV